ncbi:MAG: hypothetical protein KDK99_13740 [Verrucomicrobiales bacterium]|nr:hypothetical protein [Verrucomicrobiales bacterium]
MSAHAVFRGVSPAFRPALTNWLKIHPTHPAETAERTAEDSIEVATDEETLMALLDTVRSNAVEKTDKAGIKDFYLAIFALDDDRCEMVNGRFALEEKELQEKLPAMASTPFSLAAARQRARAAFTR